MKLRIKTRRAIAEGIGWLSWLMTLGLIGGMERGKLALSAGAGWAFGLLILGTAAMYKAGLFSRTRTAAPSIVAIAAAFAVICLGVLVIAI